MFRLDSALQFAVLLLASLLMPHAADAAEKPLPQVPQGFTVERVAAAPLVEHPMMAGFDDRGRLFIAESAGRNLKAAELLEELPNYVRMLEDTDGDGVFDKSTIFADKLTFPMGALWFRGALYVAAPPHIWRLEDTDGDGVADKRDDLVGKFGFTGNAADIHGCFLHPNGRIYWCDGRHGHEFVDEQGNVTSKGKAARIFSCRPDGSDVEVLCGGGMDNPVEVDFTPEGEVLGTVNILLNPRGDCLMHWVEGGVYPRHDQQDCIAEFQRTGDLLPPISNLGHVAVSGMTLCRSDVLGPEHFIDARGKGRRDTVFITEFNTHKVVWSTVERSGATFRSVEEDFLTSDDPDFHPTDVLEDADGSLLVIDTGGWFRIGCPTSQVAKPDILGAIYRVRLDGAPRDPDPRGLKLGLEKRSLKELLPFLGDPRPAVRERVIEQFATQGDDAVPVLRTCWDGHVSSVAVRRNAVWALCRIGTALALDALRGALADESKSVRQSAVHALGTNRDPAAVPRLAELALSDAPAIRREAATALGRICEGGRGLDDKQTAEGVAALFESLRQGVTDRFLEHALIFALIRIDNAELTRPYLSDASPLVRRAALIALDQMRHGDLTRELVAPLLDTDDPELQKQALEVISAREGWAAETLVLLRSWLVEPRLAADRASALRGFLLAQASDLEIQELVAQALARQELGRDQRLLLLEVVARAPLPALPDSWIDQLAAALKAPDRAAQLQTVRIIRDRNVDRFDAELLQIARDEGRPEDLRIEAVAALAPRLSRLDEPLFAFLTGQLGDEWAPFLRLAAARALSDAPLTEEQLVELTSRFVDAGPLAVPVLLRAYSRTGSSDVGQALVSALKSAEATAASLSPDELTAVLRNYPPSVQDSARDIFARLGIDPRMQQAQLEAALPLVQGGNAERGKSAFFSKRTACAGCHAIGGEGGRVGPDLTKIGASRTGRDLLEAVLLPSASFARGYRPYLIVTSDGRVHNGIISSETADSVTLRTAELAEIRIARGDIEEMKESGTSIMPKGLDSTLTPDELRDLLAYLQGLK